MKHWVWMGLASVIAGVGAIKGGATGISVLLHWPVVVILIAGYRYDLKGSLSAGGFFSFLMVALFIAGLIVDWTLVGWQFLIYGFFALYPYKFMQIRVQRRHHYTILTDYKRVEIDSLKRKTEAIQAKCREVESRLRGPR